MTCGMISGIQPVPAVQQDVVELALQARQRLSGVPGHEVDHVEEACLIEVRGGDLDAPFANLEGGEPPTRDAGGVREPQGRVPVRHAHLHHALGADRLHQDVQQPRSVGMECPQALLRVLLQSLGAQGPVLDIHLLQPFYDLQERRFHGVPPSQGSNRRYITAWHCLSARIEFQYAEDGRSTYGQTA